MQTIRVVTSYMAEAELLETGADKNALPTHPRGGGQLLHHWTAMPRGSTGFFPVDTAHNRVASCHLSLHHDPARWE